MNRFLPALFLGIAGLAPAAEPTPASIDYLAEARATIEAANADWIPAMKRKDARAIASFYMTDGVLVAPNGDEAKGREAVEKFYARAMEGNVRYVSGSIAQDGIVLVPGPAIYEWGHAQIEAERDGRIVRGGGAYLTVWKRDASGTWRISRNLAL